MDDNPLCGFDFSDEEENSTQKDRQAKLNQSEEMFQVERKLWRPVCQSKQAARRLEFSIDSIEPPLSKEEAMEIKAAAEERYYSCDFEKSIILAGRALASGKLQSTDKEDLLSLQERCKSRLKN